MPPFWHTTLIVKIALDFTDLFLMKIQMLFIASFLVAISASAGESGILFQGKEYVLYRDGKKVSDLPSEVAQQLKNRKPASENNGSGFREDTNDPTTIYFQRSSEGVNCYYRSTGDGGHGASGSVSCVKVK